MSMWPMAGKIIGDYYYLSTPARFVQYLLVFALSTLAYGIAFSKRWPQYRDHPAGFVVLHIMLAAIVIRLAPFATGIAAGLMDHRYQDMRETVAYWTPFAPAISSLTLPLQMFLPPYLLGLASIGFSALAREYHLESIQSAKLWAAAR